MRSVRAAVPVLLVAALAAACSGTSSSGSPGAGSSAAVPTSTQSPFTGLATPIGQKVLAVKVDNASQARPQRGLTDADIVYVEHVEGGLSRFLAVYSSNLPAAVGPVRSARESDLELLRQFGRPALAFSGANAGVQNLVRQAPVVDVSQDKVPGAYFRGTDHLAPHNLYAHPTALLKPAAQASTAADIGFRFGPAPAGGTAKTSYSISYPVDRFGFTWSKTAKRWLVSMNGTRATSGGKRLGAATVVLQYTTIRSSRFHDVLGNVSPYTETVGSGKLVVLRDGSIYRGQWSRLSAAGGTTFSTTQGASLTFATGQVWVLYLPAS